MRLLNLILLEAATKRELAHPGPSSSGVSSGSSAAGHLEY